MKGLKRLAAAVWVAGALLAPSAAPAQTSAGIDVARSDEEKREEEKREEKTRQNCRDLLTSTLPSTALNNPDLELRQASQRRLAQYFAQSKSFSVQQKKQMLDAARDSTIALIDREQEHPTGEQLSSAVSGAAVSFIREVGEIAPESRTGYLADLNDHLAEINSLQDIAPQVLDMVRSLDLPVFKSDAYVDKVTRYFVIAPSSSAAPSLTQAMDLASRLRAEFNQFNQEQLNALQAAHPGTSGLQPDLNLSAQRLQDTGLSASALRTLASQLADQYLAPQGASVPEPVDAIGGMEFVVQLLRSYGLPDKAADLEKRAQAVSALLAQTALSQPKSGFLGDVEESIKRDKAREERIRELEQQYKDDPELAEEKVAEVAAEIEYIDRGTRFKQSIEKLVQLGKLDTAARVAEKAKDPDTAYEALFLVGQAYVKAGDKSQALYIAHRAEAELHNVRDREYHLIRWWSQYLNLMGSVDPEEAWGTALPNAVHDLDDAFEKSAWNYDGKSYEAARNSTLAEVLFTNGGGNPADQLDGLFMSLAAKDPKGRPRFAADEALGAATGMRDPTLRFAAELAVCSVVIDPPGAAPTPPPGGNRQTPAKLAEPAE